MKNRWLPTLLLLFSTLFIGCMQPPEINKDFGIEVTPAEVSQALTSAQTEASSHSVNNIYTGEFSYIEKSNQIENLYPVVFRQRADTVIGRTEDANKISYTINRELRELESTTGNMKPSKSQYTACLEKTPGSCVNGSAILTAAVSSFSFLSESLNILSSVGDEPPPQYGVHSGVLGELNARSIIARATDAASSPTTKWTFHNLKKTYSSMSTPSLVAIRPDCGGRPGSCEMPMRTIQLSFDEVDWTTEVNPVKYSYILVFSPEAPYFAAQILSCGSTTIPYKSQRIALMQCETVKDFVFGKLTP